MLQCYRNQSEKARFIEKLEQLLLQGFGISAKVEEDRVQTHQSNEVGEKEVRQSTFFKSKAEKERIEAERVKAEERYEMALEMVLDASKLNSRIIADMEINPKQYVNLLKRKVFNPHKCNITDRMQCERATGIGVAYKVNRKAWRSSSFALLYAIMSNWIRDEDMTIMECDAIYQKFNCSCQVANSSQAQKILFQLYKQIQNGDARVLQKMGCDLPKTFFTTPDKSYVKLFVEYWDCEYTLPSSKDNDIWSNLSLEETIEQARKGIGPVKRSEIPWATRYREKYHTFWRK